MAFQFEPQALPGVILVRPRVFEDARGYFMETYRQDEFAAGGIAEPFVQENQSRSQAGTLRGLHFQRGVHAQGKLVRCVHGEIYDVAVDLRLDAPTFGRWVGATLSAANRCMLYVPPWCGHGFVVRSPEADVVYKVTRPYAPEHEGGVRWDDPDLAIPWDVDAPVLSARDTRWPSLAELAARRRAGGE